MAVKERKQITGTTAQINAYKGHEGQIVWDKEKKTLVGMSGTAGKNYPLAPKTYVDNEVAKVNTEVAKKQPKGDYATNAKVTEGLAGKEDKGTCLPLTGGQVTGDIWFDTGAIISGMSQDGAFRELLLGSDAKEDPSGNAGAFLALRNSGGSLDPLRGSFAIHTRLADTTMPYILEGRTSGDLTWSGQTIDSYVDVKYQTHPSGGGLLCYRCRSGLQFMFGSILVGPDKVEHLVFPYPFVNAGYAIACQGLSPHPDIMVSTWDKTTTGVLIRKGNIDKVQSFETSVQLIIFGNWK